MALRFTFGLLLVAAVSVAHSGTAQADQTPQRTAIECVISSLSERISPQDQRAISSFLRSRSALALPLLANDGTAETDDNLPVLQPSMIQQKLTARSAPHSLPRPIGQPPSGSRAP